MRTTWKTKLFLLSTAGSMIVVIMTDRAAQAADIPVVKVNPVDYVDRCPQFGLHYGVAELNMEVEADVSWHQHRQDLAHDPWLPATPLPSGISPNSSNWIFSLNFARNFGGALGKNLAGF